MHQEYIGDSLAFHVKLLQFNFSIMANCPKPTSFSCFKFKPCRLARASPFSTSTSHSESELRSKQKKSNSSFDSMNSAIAFSFDDKDLDDAALWAIIDSAAAASLSSAITSPGPHAKPLTPIPFPLNSPQPQFENRSRNHRHNHNPNLHGEVVQNHRPHKIPRTTTTPRASPQQLMVVKHAHRTPTTPPAYTTASSTDTRDLAMTEYCSPNASTVSCEKAEARHSLAGQFPTVSLFKEYQDAAMAILEKSDYTMISGNTYIKKTGWRKISFYFNLSFEIKDKTIEFDENRNVQRAEFIVRAYMQGGRFSDGWGSCERREKKFSKPNHDIPSTAETRAKNRACQDLLGIGEYRPGARHAQG